MVRKKRKPARYSKTTVLIVGEGPTEKAFLQYLKELYVSRESNFAVKIECGSGGDPKSVIQKTIRLRGSRGYDKCFVLIDSDRPLKTDGELKRRMRAKPRIEILKATPCAEGLFLSILRHPKFSQNNTTSDICKREFETSYISAGRKTDKRSYAGKFSRKFIDERREIVSELDAILKAMQS